MGGAFYPSELPGEERLTYHGERFSAVEINNTFYRMPKREVLERWAAAVPEGFLFAIKASRRITHEGRLKDEDEGLAYLLGQLESLGDKCAPILFQTPPYLRKGVERLRGFVARLPSGVRAAFEFRHDSWDDPEIHDVLREGGHALCVSELDEIRPDREVTKTASWGYLRLHQPMYDDAQLRAWAERIGEIWEEAFVFFKHDKTGPELARRMIAIVRELGSEA